MDMTPYSLTITEACKRYGIGRSRLYELIATKQIAAKKLGARTLVLAESIEGYLAALPDSHAA
jgi:excisionase family DNA binding protein